MNGGGDTQTFSLLVLCHRIFDYFDKNIVVALSTIVCRNYLRTIECSIDNALLDKSTFRNLELILAFKIYSR